MKIIVSGRIPSKKNNVNIFVKNNKLFKTPSSAYRSWHKESCKQLSILKGCTVESPSHVEITIFAPDKRKSDLTNKAESIMDLLVDNGIMKDDNWFVVPKINLVFGGVDKFNPRAEITIQ